MKKIVLVLLIMLLFEQCCNAPGSRCNKCAENDNVCICETTGFYRNSYTCGFTDLYTFRDWKVNYSGNAFSIERMEEDMLKNTKYAKTYGDTLYNGCWDNCPRSFIADTIRTINIIANKEYAGFPAGVSLNDIFFVTYKEVKKFVKSNYNRDDAYKNNFFPLEQKNKIVSNFNKDSLENYLILASLKFSISRFPSKSDNYIFTITLKGKVNGNTTTVSKQLEPIFIQ